MCAPFSCLSQGALRLRQRALTQDEDQQASAAVSSFRRTPASSSGTTQADKDLDAATPELALKLKKRQEQAEVARRHSEGAAEGGVKGGGGEAAARGGVVSADGASSSNSAGVERSSATTPFGGELASVLLKR